MNDTQLDEKAQTYQNLDMVQKNLGYQFKSMELLEVALTHSSWANETGNSGRHNERMEFLGDAVLELTVSTHLFRIFPEAREGDLTRMRADLVKADTLAMLSRESGIADALKLGKGEEKQGGRTRDSVLSDAMEAVFAAVYLDGGFVQARKVIKRLYKSHWPATVRHASKRDCKSRLQEMTQHLYHDFPVYKLEKTHGPEHARIFEVKVMLPDGRTFQAADSSCKKAEQQAAALALAELDGKQE